MDTNATTSKVALNELLKKYNKPVPRYTSYPPANFFQEGYTARDYIADIEQSNHVGTSNISIYIHIPYCTKMCHFCGCNSRIMDKAPTVEAYLDALIKELKLTFQYIDNKRLVSQIHYGGGTPNAISTKWLRQINETIFSTFDLTENAEIAIECNPAYLDEKYVRELHQARFNRFSLGIQDFNTDVLDAVNRDPAKLPMKELMKLLKTENDATPINFDFIYGLPRQTPESFSKTIRRAVELNPERIVTFSYAHVPWVNKAQKKLEEQGLPEYHNKAKMFDHTCSITTQAGYKAIGLDHFVLEQDELYQAKLSGTLHRNFQGYCTRATTGQVYAFGMSGIGQLHHAYMQNTKNIPQYVEAISNNQLPINKGYKLSQEQIIIREVITEIMCNRKVHWQEIGNRFSISAEKVKETLQYDQTQLDELESDGIISTSSEQLSVTEEGTLFIRNVASAFDPLLKTSKKSFSKPV